MESAMAVKLDPKEHQRFVWATEEEVRARKVGNLEIQFTTTDLEATVLEAFGIRGQAKDMPASSCL